MNLKLVAAMAALPLVALAQPAMAQRAGEPIAGSYICVFNANVSRGSAQAEANRAAQAEQAQLKHVYSVALRGFAVNASPQAVANMQRNNPNIAYCEQDQVVTSSVQQGQFRGQARPGGGGGAQPAQETPWGIARVNGGAAGNFATAWVIDTGIQFDHPDLNVDVQRSRSFLSRGDANDENGHGTHVAGTIAAMDNAIGVIGVAPGARVVAVRVLDRRGSGSNSGVIAGVDYVAQFGQPGDVANMSLGGGVSTALDQAVVNAAAGGVRFALAAGNESDSANNHSPARANGNNVYTVSSFAVGDRWSSFSNYGNPPVDYAEPGSAIKSTWIGSGYNTISGTSMATPHLAGLLLAGAVRNGGNVQGDPDGNPDIIGVH
ncbi:S8 family serine peptidase [Aurantiacibacter luteus]|uniref:Peptidase S8 n=1 Tax=Aurantiacibacter luteus TaxID=1581420 RepID=A0A0G9MT02_9SPHN|nr:S8 family serine peptidase [Aurantiacibacter luteus]KLE33902.1 peptidase S8 [Aurantiacibacter luteus]